MQYITYAYGCFNTSISGNELNALLNVEINIYTLANLLFSIVIDNRHFEFADIISATDYSPFGAPLPGRTYSSSKYRFGYNKGSEKDDEIYGEGNSYTTYFREIDVRIVRLWGTDPSVKAWESPFVLNHNSPLLFVDPFGDDPPKRLSLWSRVDNVMKGDSYKNKANKYAVKNKVDEARITTGNGKVKIDESYYKNYQSGSEKGLLTGGTTLIEKSVVFNDSDPEEGNKYDWAGNSPVKSAGFGHESGLSAQMAGGFLKGEFKNQSEQLSNSETGLGNGYNRGIITLSHTILGGNSEIFENKASFSNYTYLMVDFKSRAMPSNANYKYVMEVVNVLQISAFKMEWNETTEQLKVGLEWGNPKRIELSKNVEHNIQLYEQFNK
jgi:hypothetical protein